MEDHDQERTSFKDLPVYVWHNKQEGKDEYAKFAKQFKIAIKNLRYLLEPGAVERKLGQDPGPMPVQMNLRSIWREDKRAYDSRLAKIEDNFATALSALESSFAFATSPRHIIDKAIDEPPAGVPDDQWTYRLKFNAAWEALRQEYQPSTAVDVSQLKQQIMALNDQIPGGFDQFKSEFHRLHTEILATQVANAITPNELNSIVRQGIKNPTVWGFVGYRIYDANPDLPWQEAFDAISSFLTSFRQKGMDPYGEANAAPMVGHLPVAANAVSAMAVDMRAPPQKRKSGSPRDSGGRFQKSQKTSTTESYSEGKYKWTNTQTTSKQDSNGTRTDRKCTRCWQSTTHGYRDCQETKCVCGATLAPGQAICYNYDTHSSNAKFTEDRLPKALSRELEAYRRGKNAFSPHSPSGTPEGSKPNTRSKAKKSAKAMAATVAEELIRRGITGENLDSTA